MEAHIKEITKDQEIASIKNLRVTDCKSSNVTGLSEDYKSLENLSVESVGLTTLKSFPRLINLKKLELTNNKLSEGLDALACLPKLTTVDLSGNRIKDLEVLQPLKEISTLTHLNLEGCDVAEIENYRKKIFELIPSLQILDGLDKDNKPTEEESKENDEDVDDEDEDDEEEIDLDEDEEDDEEEEEGAGVPLSAIYNKLNDEEGEEEEEDDEDFEGGDVDEEEDLDEEEGDEDVAIANLSVEKVDGKTRGTKRKLPEEEAKKSEAKK